MKKYKWEDDIKDCYYTSPANFLYVYILGGCGCGSGDRLAEIAWEVFELFANKTEDRWKKIYGEGEEDGVELAYEAMAQWMNSKNLIEHGTSIAGSWLSQEGERLYKIFKEKPSAEEPSDGIYQIKSGMI